MTMKNCRGTQHFFQNAVSKLNIKENSFIQSKYYHNLSDPVQKAITKYKHQHYSRVLLLRISKIFAKLMEKQLNHYIQNHLPLYLCGYWKGYNTQQALLVLFGSWKKR